MNRRRLEDEDREQGWKKGRKRNKKIFFFSFSFSFQLFFFFLMTHLVSADPLDFFCSGPHSRMSGCSGIAGSGGYEAVYFNPSLLPVRREIGLGFLFADQKPNIYKNGQKIEKAGNPLEDVSQLNIGLAFPLSDIPIFEKSKILENIYFGTTGYLPPSGRVVRVGNNMLREPSTLLYGNRNTRFSLYVGLGGRIPIENINIYLGGSVHSLAHLPIIVDANLSPDKDLLVIDGALELVEGFVGGAAFEYTWDRNFVRLGGVYRSSVGIEIPTSVRVNVLGDQALSLVASLFDVFTPSYLGGGLALGYRIEKLGLILSFDFVRYMFSDFKLPLLEVQEVEPTEFSALLPKNPVPKLRDVNVLKGGVRANLGVGEKTDVIVGAGLYLFPSPLVSQNSTLFVDSDRTVISGGGGLSFPSPGIIKGNIEILLSGQFHMLSKKDFSTVVDGNPVNTSIDGNLFSLSASLNFVF